MKMEERNSEQALTELKREVNHLHVSVGLHLKSAKEDAAAAGEKLIEAKSVLPHGQFKAWVEANCEFSYRQARKYMQVAKAKVASRGQFEQCASMAEVLSMGKEYEAAKPQHIGDCPGKDSPWSKRLSWMNAAQRQIEEGLDGQFEGWKQYGEAMLEARKKFETEQAFRDWWLSVLDHEITREEEAVAIFSAKEPARFHGLRLAFPSFGVTELGEIILEKEY